MSVPTINNVKLLWQPKENCSLIHAADNSAKQHSGEPVGVLCAEHSIRHRNVRWYGICAIKFQSITRDQLELWISYSIITRYLNLIVR